MLETQHSCPSLRLIEECGKASQSTRILPVPSGGWGLQLVMHRATMYAACMSILCILGGQSSRNCLLIERSRPRPWIVWTCSFSQNEDIQIPEPDRHPHRPISHTTPPHINHTAATTLAPCNHRLTHPPLAHTARTAHECWTTRQWTIEDFQAARSSTLGGDPTQFLRLCGDCTCSTLDRRCSLPDQPRHRRGGDRARLDGYEA